MVPTAYKVRMGSECQRGMVRKRGLEPLSLSALAPKAFLAKILLYRSIVLERLRDVRRSRVALSIPRGHETVTVLFPEPFGYRQIVAVPA